MNAGDTAKPPGSIIGSEFTEFIDFPLVELNIDTA
jgi:hypothetical protein